MELETMALSSAEIARAIEFLRAIGISEKTINDFLFYVASGHGLQEYTEAGEEKEAE